MKTVRVLYVEDEPSLARIVKESLESRNFEVLMADDGPKALEVMDHSTPDICVLDVMLPTMDGFTLAIKLRKIHSGIPILFLTARTQLEDLVKGFESGGNDYLRKPFSMEELIVRINNLLQLTKRTESRDQIKMGIYTLWPNKFELHSESAVRKLSHREVQLLQLLYDNRNSVTQRKEILMKLWGDDSFFNSRNLDVYITKMRDCLKQDPNIQIMTVKGVGYHFSIPT